MNPLRFLPKRLNIRSTSHSPPGDMLADHSLVRSNSSSAACSSRSMLRWFGLVSRCGLLGSGEFGLGPATDLASTNVSKVLEE